MTAIKCPSGQGKDCPNAELCKFNCHFQTAELPKPPPARPAQYRPTYEVEHWTRETLTPAGWAVLVIGLVLACCLAAELLVGIVR